MPKKADKRRHKRRHQHQAGQGAGRSERRTRLTARVEAIQEALAELAAVATDPAVPADEVAAMAARLTTAEGALHGFLGNSQMADPLAAEIVEDAGAPRAAEVARALERQLAANHDLAWFALALAEEADDLDLAARIAEKSFEEIGDWDDEEAALLSAQVGSIRWRQGGLGDALTLVHEWCARWPGSEDLMGLRAQLIAHTVAIKSGDPDLATVFPYPVDGAQLAAADDALTRFCSRDLLDRLRGAVEAFVDADPVLSAGRDRHLAEFFELVAGVADVGPLDTTDETFAMLAAERYWLHDEEDDPAGETSVLGRFAADPSTPADLAGAARHWLHHVRYGLWLADWEDTRDSQRGVWLTDIVTRRRVYASIPPEQMEGVARWTVLAGALAPVDGVWRSGQTLLALDPTLADEAAETVLFNTDTVLIHLFREQGMKPRRRPPDQRRTPPPHGVLSDLLDPMDAWEADMAAKVTGSSLAQLVAMVETGRDRPPAMPDTGRIDEWVTEQLPALGGVTPSAAAGHPQKALLLEKLLRQFEHDADLVAAAGQPAIDVAGLREKLGLEYGVYDLYFTGESRRGTD